MLRWSRDALEPGRRPALIIVDFQNDYDRIELQGGLRMADLSITQAGSHAQIAFAGTTIIGDLFADDKILSVAHAYQKATDWHNRHPSIT